MPNPIRFSATGPNGWLALPGQPLEHAELLEGFPVGRDAIYYERPEAGVRSGIWRSSAYTERYENYPCDEFMVILDGEITLEAEGFRETYRKGDAFLLPKGFKGTWRQPVETLKFYVMIGA